MNKAMLLVGIIMLAMFTFGVINITSSYQTGNELDYYLLNETTEAAMLDAVDIGYYRLSGGLYRMDKEKFTESFVRRFAQNVANTRDYDIKIYDINETPPKVTIKIDSNTSTSFNGDTLKISNKISSIMETNYKSNELTTKLANAGELDYSKIDEVYTKALNAS